MSASAARSGSRRLLSACIVGAGAAGILAASPGPSARIIVIALLAAVLAGVIVVSCEGSDRVARGLLWGAVVLPFIYSTSRTAGSANDLGVGPLDAVRGGGPIVLLGLAWLIKRPPRCRPGLTELSLMGFCITAVASAAWSVDFSSSALKGVVLTASYIALWHLVRHYGDPSRALSAGLNSLYIALIWTVVQWIVVPDAWALAGNVSRLGSIFPQISANPLGYFAAAGILGLLLKVGPAWAISSPLRRIALLFAFVAILMATRTRVALIVTGLLVIFALFLVIRRQPLLATMGGLGLGAVALILAIAKPDAVGEFLRRGQTERSIATLTGRTEIWALAMNQWQEHPVLGSGYYAAHRIGIPGLSADQSNLDSTWIESLVDVGIIGTVLLALFVLSGTYACLVRRSIASGLRWWALGVIVYGVAASFVSPTIQAPGPAMLLMGFVLLAVRAGVVNRPGFVEALIPLRTRAEPAPRKYPNDERERAMRLVSEAGEQEPDLSLNAAVKRIGPRGGIT